MKVNPELEVLSKLSEIFSDVKYSSYQGDITVELTGISHDFQVLSELLLPVKTMGTSAPTVKTENPIVRRDTLGAESIGRKYKVMSDDDCDFLVGSIVKSVSAAEYNRDDLFVPYEDGEVFSPSVTAKSLYMYPETLLQEITEDGAVS